MRLARLKALAHSLPAVTSVHQWVRCLVFKVGGKMFLVLVLDGDLAEAATFKVTPADYARLTALDGLVRAPHSAPGAWVQLQDFAALPESELNALIRASYDLVRAGLTKKIRATLPAA